ncbi:MAG: NYN domain-containing protein [Microcella sp.]|uniref:NYN domain-containing protein n=1 Tax=Microcella sp. TaxID=1913979 RepID=UPI0024C7822A|nr:NYN domain-containing protein [Microcella sp.]UYN82877.1 MAG: NYN domain-containing protein [Microcella sp.]
MYVDGFNLYRQKLQHHPDAKWLDLVKLSELLLPTHDIVGVEYFTALLKPALGTDPQAPIRQQTYLRALTSLPTVRQHFGQFRHDTRRLPVIPIELDEAGAPRRVKVRKTEEKGSDVNLAARMVVDASRQRADVYVLVSNDSDFADMLRLLGDELNARFGLFSPVESPAARLLQQRPLFIKPIRRAVLLASQLPRAVVTPDGKTVHRPAEWR